MGKRFICKKCGHCQYDDDYCVNCGRYDSFESYYPYQFIVWLFSFGNKHIERVGVGWRISTYKQDEYFKERNLDEVFDYWINEIMGNPALTGIG